ncbi:MAG: sigma-70 family RNA polymerase sigma factor [Alphaproteobacteria bacterium]|nr:sigma-70 family RNA polymerase sigma factor [Alphaproteobacteria bacterium]
MDEINRLIVDQVPHLRRYARALLRDADAADDLVQDCLTRAMGRLHLWTPGSNMRTWLFSILHNQHVNSARRLAHRPDQIDFAPSHAALQATHPEQSGRHEVRDLGRALEQLPEEQRQVILLVGLEGLAYSEVAHVLDLPMGTVMSRLNRGRQRLREIIEQDEGPVLRRVK